MKQRFTTVHDRYQVSDSCCGQVETATSLKKASEIAKNHADRHAIDHDNTTTVVTVFDVMAQRDCQDTWEFPIANAYNCPQCIADKLPAVKLVQAPLGRVGGSMQNLVWRVRWKNLEGWQYSPKTFTSVDKARKEADRIPDPWPIDIVPEVRS